MNDVIEHWRERVREAAAAGAALRLRGGGSKDFYGRAPRGELFETGAYAGVVAYEPTELVVTARAGTPLAELERVLAAQHQMLAFEPPHFGAAATVGGCVAAGLSGPRRQAAGALRDFVLGVKVMDGRAEVLKFGGQVMKNVAGYDVSRLIAGSLGTLGLILEVSLKVLPRPASEVTLRFAMSEREAIDRINRWGGQPLPLSASAWHAGTLTLRLSGAEAAVRSASAKLGGDVVAAEEASGFWTAVREHSHAFFTADGGGAIGTSGGNRPGDVTDHEADKAGRNATGQREAGNDGALLWRVSVPSTASALDLSGEQFIEWGGALRWLRTALPADTIRARASALGGHATCFRGGDRQRDVFHALPAPIMTIHRRLKHAFDPAGVFNPGRLYDGL